MQKLSQNTSLQTLRSDSISIYDDRLTARTIIDQVKRIKSAFPSLPEGFYDILSSRIKETGFTDQRLVDAVNNLIDTCVYPQPTIAQLVNWDRRIKLYTYSQIVAMIDRVGSSVWDEYKAVDLPGYTARVYASIIDIEQFNLKLKLNGNSDNQPDN